MMHWPKEQVPNCGRPYRPFSGQPVPKTATERLGLMHQWWTIYLRI